MKRRQQASAPASNALRSGIWSGHYIQRRRQHAQQMRLEFADGLMRGSGDDEIGNFTIEGEYRVVGGEVRLGWIKTYDRSHSVLYLGTLADGEISGRWDIHGMGEGFALRFAP